MKPILNRMEPDCLTETPGGTALLSIAMSLKRIADSLDMRSALHDALKHGESAEDVVMRVRDYMDK